MTLIGLLKFQYNYWTKINIENDLGHKEFACFFGFGVREKLFTNLERTRRHLHSDSRCPVCHSAKEFVIHVLRECVMAHRVPKKKTIPIGQRNEFYRIDP